jgi:RNA polymerase sigma factor (sigma-70 family)
MGSPLDEAAAARRFHTTRWSLIIAAAKSTPETRTALAELCRLYWPPVYAFVRRSHEREDALDLTQSFFARILEHHDLARVDRRRGRFRNWLLAALQHFLINDWRHEHAKKRGGGAIPLSLDAIDAEERHVRAAVDSVTPAQLYEHRWVHTLLHLVMDKLEHEQAQRGQLAWFKRLQPHMLADEDATSYQGLARELGVAEGALRVQVSRLRRRYRDLLHAQVAETVDSEDEVTDELRSLLAALL